MSDTAMCQSSDHISKTQFWRLSSRQSPWC